MPHFWNEMVAVACSSGNKEYGYMLNVKSPCAYKSHVQMGIPIRIFLVFFSDRFPDANRDPDMQIEIPI
jgi:hypothetical protein